MSIMGTSFGQKGCPSVISRLSLVLLGSILSLSFGCAATANKPVAVSSQGLPSIASATDGMDRHEGLLAFHTDGAKGRVLLELAPVADGSLGEFLYVEGLRTGLGSNPVGLDRGQLGETRIVRFRRFGRKILLEQDNLAYRATSPRESERRAVKESFATSVLWAGEAMAEGSDGTVLIDISSFLVSDAHGVAERLQNTNQGSFKLDASRSAVDLTNCLAFVDNVEFEALLTYGGSKPGTFVRETTPTPESITLVQHHSFIRLPDDGYQPRTFDPRAGSYSVGYADYGVELDEPLDRRLLVRHRLRKKNPGAPTSPVVEPIVYYVDGGAPPAVRQALIDGASWWADAFERAGFENAFRVEVLPDNVHPLDVRYNVIQWVHRSTRGWSYGGGIIDPRTGEMLKGHVSLGSLRVRQDRLLFEGLAGTEQTGTGAADDPVELALARIRQLSAHEVGHALGLTHNFAGSTYGGRASVMDYPAPLIDIRDGVLDFSRAYGVGVGKWDLHAVEFAYREFGSSQDESAALHDLVRSAHDRGLHFVADHHARPRAAMHPLGSLWDNGSDPVSALDHAMNVRRIALDGFAERSIRAGEPLAKLQEVFATVYLHHRFQILAAAKLIGGVEFTYSLRGDGRALQQAVDPDRQRQALRSVLRCLSPDQLDIADSINDILAPQPPGYADFNRELFASHTSPLFDALGAAATASDMVLDVLLDPSRCARLVELSRRRSDALGFDEMLSALLDVSFERSATGRLALVQEVSQRAVVDRLVRLAAEESTPTVVRARVDYALRDLVPRLSRLGTAHSIALIRDLRRYLDHQEWDGPTGWQPADAPPGQPIGMAPLGCGADPRTW